MAKSKTEDAKLFDVKERKFRTFRRFEVTSRGEKILPRFSDKPTAERISGQLRRKGRVREVA
jgi:hypothetical protein